MPTQTADLFLVDDVQDARRTHALPERDVTALQGVATWIESFIVQPHQDLGRSGPVCPYVAGAIDRRKLWLAPEQVGDRDAADVAELMTGYRRFFQDTEPADGPDAGRSAIIVVFTDLPAARAPQLFDDVLQQIAIPAYVDDGIVFGPFYQGHEGTAIHNPGFRPFQSPTPFIFVRYGVVGDWKFFLDDDGGLGRFAHRFGESAVHALAGELRRLPWREARR